MINGNTYISPSNILIRLINIIGLKNTLKLIEIYKNKPKSERRIRSASMLCNMLDLKGVERVKVYCKYNGSSIKRKEYVVPCLAQLDKTIKLSNLRIDIDSGFHYRTLVARYGANEFLINRVKKFKPLHLICNDL